MARLDQKWALVVLASGVAACFSAPRYVGPASPHFDGERFINERPVPAPGPTDLIALALTPLDGAWQPWTDNEVFPTPPAEVGHGDLQVTFINHATTLIQMDGINILTDPIWSERCSPVSFAGPRRARAPGVALDALPRIDAVVVSHNHYDHLDLATLSELASRHPGLRIFVGLGNDKLLEAAAIPGAEPLDWGQSARLSEHVTVTAWPAQHFSGRGLSDRGATLWSSYVISGAGGPVYFAGDTGFGGHFEAAGRQLGPFRLALLPIGAYLPRWFMAPIHISPAEAVVAAEKLRAATSVAIHFGTFPLARDGQYKPIRDLRLALAQARPRPRFWVLQFGESRAVPPLRGRGDRDPARHK